MVATKQKGRPPRGRRRRGGNRRRGSSDGPVPLYKRSGSHFQSGDRQRGEGYFAEGRVQLAVEGSRARARVEGSERDSYAVGVDWTLVPGKRALHVYCQCERFAGGAPCKHIWATLLSLAETGPENQPPGRDRLGLRKDRPASWADLGISVAEEEARMREARPTRKRGGGRGHGRRSAPVTWRTQFAEVGQQAARLATAGGTSTSPAAIRDHVLLLVNIPASQTSDSLVLDVFARELDADGVEGKLKRISLAADQLERVLAGSRVELPEASDPMAVVTAVPAARQGRQPQGRRKRSRGQRAKIRRFLLPSKLYDRVLPRLAAQRSLGWWDGRAAGDPQPISWDGGEPWALALHLETAAAGVMRLRGGLQREGEIALLSAPLLIQPYDSSVRPEPEAETETPAADPDASSDAGTDAPADPERALVFFPDRVAALGFDRQRDLPWIELMREVGEIDIPDKELDEAFATLLELPVLPRLEAPEELQLTEERSVPQPRLVLEPGSSSAWVKPPLVAELSFEYGRMEVSAKDSRAAVVDREANRYVRRDLDREHQALVRLLELGLQPVETVQGHELTLAPTGLPTVVEPLLTEGWSVEVHGTTVRPPSPPSMRVESGIDWFEVSGQVDFAGDSIDMSTVLAAISRGEHFIVLPDGSQGLLPASLMETYESLAQLSQSSSEEGLRFHHSQAMLVDALLTAMPPADVDEAFAELRQKLRTFERIKPKKESRSFKGELRAYQREGLGWLAFLREYGLGGVLADDMGLGKTVQVLALLQAYRTAAKTTGLPTLVVAPRSVVYNWLDEAANFTPKLKVVEYRGPDREAIRKKISRYDIVVTTYGTLRRDIGYLATVEFDTVILDEAQAIKNPASQTAKASRLLSAQHRLALTGTPIENHLGELGSLFEFLNPGLMGRLPALEVLNGGHAPSRQELALVSRGIRPFILRRTKAEVLPDLPPKTEQVLLTDLRPEQRELYDQLRLSLQASLMEQVESKGLAGSSIQVLAALLRLRQIACHPGLVREEWEEAGSAKLDALYEQVMEVLEEGHKVIVFSQFTKLLAYVRRHFDEQGIGYSYLDGQTRNRGEVVEAFQTDADRNLFLISLKAGGTGLNLTAAGYVFLLDPWWNPAVEAQAIDRAHRIGQTQPVFAYRMIAQDTVEEKIVELQRSKRQLADAILEGEGQTLKDLTADDLRMLLS